MNQNFIAQPKLSIIVATFNSELFLHKSLQSILNQTFRSYELIIVDDASTDGTEKIAQHYAENYEQVRYIKNEINLGCGGSRNVGLRAARGEYIGFMDSDDYIDCNYYKDLYESAINFGADVVCANIKLIYPEKVVKSHLEDNNHISLNTQGEEGIRVIQPEIIVSHWAGMSACTKIIRRLLFNSFPFFEGGASDDIPAIVPILLKANKIVYQPFQYYNYVQRIGSMENSGFNNKRLDVASSIRLACKRVQEINSNEIVLKILFANSVFSTLLILFKSENHGYIEKFYQLLNHENNLEKYLDANNNLFLNNNLGIWSPVGLQLYYRRAVNLFMKGRIDDLKQHLKEWKENPERFCPRVSIVIPVYNGSNYMKEAIGSALSQTYPNIEVIVVNDGSTDNGETDKIARSYGDRIRYIKKPNGGVATALNEGIKIMTGEYFAWLSHDDIYTFDKIEREIEYLFKQSDKTTFVAGGYTIVDKAGNKLYDVNLKNRYTDDQINKPLFAVMRGGINGCATLIHKSHFNRVGLFNPELPTTQDYDLWFRILRGQPIAYYDGCYVKSRSHDEQDSKKLFSTHVEECDTLWIRLVKSLNTKEMCEMEGSVLDFYIKTRDFFVNSTGYKKIVVYLNHCILDMIVKDIKSGNCKMNKLYQETKIARRVLMQDSLKNLVISNKVKPRIVFLHPFSPNELGGLNKIVLQLAGLLTSNYEVILISNEHCNGSGYQLIDEVIQINAPQVMNNTDSLVKLMLILDVDICVISHNCSFVPLSLYKPLRDMGIKTIAWSHEFYFLPYWNAKLHNCLLMKNSAFSCANAVVWLNSTSASIYSQLYNNAVVMPNMVTIDKTIEHTRRMPNNIVAVSRFDDPRKGLNELLQVFKKISMNNKTVQLYVVGPYDLEQKLPNDDNMTYEVLIRKLNLPLDRIHFTGWVKDVEQYYQNACLHLMTSCYEGFGLAITEAAAYKIPSMIFEGSGLDDIITDGVDGYIIPQGNIDEMAEKAIELLDNQEKLEQMREATVDIIKKYNKDDLVERWESLINLILRHDMSQQEELNTLLHDKFMFEPKNEKALYKQAVKEYEECIQKLLESRKETTDELGNIVYYASSDGEYQQECINMMNSFSWKVTKPLRLIRKVELSLRRNGIKETIIKIKRKLNLR